MLILMNSYKFIKRAQITEISAGCHTRSRKYQSCERRQTVRTGPGHSPGRCSTSCGKSVHYKSGHSPQARSLQEQPRHSGHIS